MLVRVLIILIFICPAQAELYRCEATSGEVQFTDNPCGTVYKPKAIMTPYKTIKPINLNSKKISKESVITNKKTCPFINSTEIRNLKVKDEYKKGLAKKHIIKRLGKADNIKENKNSSTWVYNGDYVKRTFKFKENCLTSWKEKWKQGKESQISKFRDER